MWCAEISCNKNVIGKIPIKTCEERAESLPANEDWEGKDEGGGGGGQESLIERGESCREKVRGREGSGRGRLRDILLADHWIPCHPSAWKKSTFGFSWVLSPFFIFFFKSCFHLAHGSAPSNSWVSQTKSYFLIHSLSHIIILLDRVSQFFFQAFFSSTACSVLGVTSQPQWGKKRRPGSYSMGQRSGLLPLVHTYLIPIL